MFSIFRPNGADAPLAGSPKRPDRVIIYGRYSPDWDTRIDIGAPLWQNMPGVREVLRARKWSELMALGLGRGRHSIVLPLRERFIANCPPLWWGLSPSGRAFAICRDKQRFAKYTRGAGLSELVPHTYANIKEVEYPCVLKRTNKTAGHGVAIVESRAQLDNLLRVKPWRRRRTIIQGLLPGHIDHVTHCVAHHGRIVWHCSYRYDLSKAKPVQSEKTIMERSRHEALPTHIAVLERFLVPLDYSGAVSFDYRLMPNGELKVFEINPRFGGSLMRPENFDHMRAGFETLIALAEPPRWSLRRKSSPTSLHA